MDTILMKYRSLDNEYLIFDTRKYHAVMDERAVRLICSRNCGLGSAGIVAGPFMENGNVSLKVFNPDGREEQSDRAAISAGLHYLKDAGYPTQGQNAEFGAAMVGKVFLSEEFVNRYLQAV